MVTKQQQLEWLAMHFKSWPFGDDSILMSDEVLGYLGHEHKITNQELKQERDKMQKQHDFDIGSNLKVSVTATSNGFGEVKINTLWYERGEFPPAGTVCEVYENEWVETFIIGMDKEGYCVYTTGNQYVGYDGENDPSNFRPIRTEREKAIGEMANLIAKSVFGSAKCQAEKLYDAGYRKVEPQPSPI